MGKNTPILEWIPEEEAEEIFAELQAARKPEVN
jgi:hypothetical protein